MTPRHAPRYTPADDECIRQNYGKLPTPVLAARLGRTPNSLIKRAHILGVKRGRKQAVYATPATIAAINAVARSEGKSYGKKTLEMHMEGI